MDASEYLRKTSRKLAWDVIRSRVPTPKIDVLHERPDGRPYQDIWPGPEFVHRIEGPVYIEPIYGWIIAESGVLVQESMPIQCTMKQVRESWKQAWRLGMPSVLESKRARNEPSRVTPVKEVISLRHPWEWNYYHFHQDVLGKLNLFRQAGVPTTLPVALGRYVDQQRFARQIVDRLYPGGAGALVPDLANRTFVRADVVYYCRTLQTYRERMDHVLDLLAVPVPVEKGGRRIFLTRRPPANRTAANLDEVESVASEFGFDVVDTVQLSIADQIQIFNETRFLIALHGAGLTNTIYRRGAPLSVLELHSDNYVSADMKNISADYGYAHDRLSGPTTTSKKAQHDNYMIDPGQLRQRIRKMLADASLLPTAHGTLVSGQQRIG